ncbi:MAG: hypothetical protein IJT36_07820, partial [Alphaproteobacteria bacterium]|nr:hypothetical protein [Alphaproteobacteria bacterium]
NLFHTNTMFNPWPFSIFFAIDFDYVKRVSENEYYYERNWGTTDSGDSPQNMFRGKDTHNTSNVKYTKSQVASIYPNLICNKDGEEKLLISCYYRNAPTGVDNSKLGFFILNPKIDWYSFSYKILITPKPGLFPTKW